MTLTQLLYAVKIAETKSMNRAANELFVSQPALSGAIRELEQELNCQLFMRTNRGIVVTPRGEEFLSYARQITELKTMVEERFTDQRQAKKRFSVSMQHYSFGVEAFIELSKSFAMNDYELAIYETKTANVIENVKNHKSEIGLLYINAFNEKVLKKIFAENELDFVPLFDCGVYVYMSASHPLAQKEKIDFKELEAYPCLSFDQGDKNAFYFAEEVLSTLSYRQTIRVEDRATMLNLMAGMMGYTLCTGIIRQHLTEGKYVAVPLDVDDPMTVGYIKRRSMPLSLLGEKYIDIIRGYKI